jgi:hypothetical protein
MIAVGFSPNAHDPALFVHTSSPGRTILLLHVDDMIITDDDSEYIAYVKAHLREQFLMGLRFPPLLMDFISPRRSISRISLLVPLGDERTVDTPMELNV